MIRVTAGLSCAPDTEPGIVISTNRIAPVASVFPSIATATLPPENRSAMMPEPITVANSQKLPRASASTARIFTPVGRDCRLRR